MWDIAYALYTSVPLGSFAPDDTAEATVPYAGARHDSDRTRRIALFLASYGLSTPLDLQD